MIQNLSEALQRLPPDEQRAFTADFPKLLIEWYRGEVGNGECSRRRTAWMGSVVCHVDAIRQTKLNHLPWRAAHSGKDHQTFLPRAAHDNGASLLNNFQHL